MKNPCETHELQSLDKRLLFCHKGHCSSSFPFALTYAGLIEQVNSVGLLYGGATCGTCLALILKANVHYPSGMPFVIFMFHSKELCHYRCQGSADNVLLSSR